MFIKVYEKGKHFDKDLNDKANDMSKSLHISEVFIIHFGIFSEIRSYYKNITCSKNILKHGKSLPYRR